MSQTPRQPDDDIRLSDEEIRAMSQGLRRQYIRSEDRSYAGAAISAVAGGFEGLIRRLLIVLRLPLIGVFALVGFLLMNGREGISFLVALIAAVAFGVVGAALIEAGIRFIDRRAYRREIR